MSEPTKHRTDAPRDGVGRTEGDDDFWDEEWQDGTWSEAPERRGRQDLLIALGVIAALVVVAAILVGTTRKGTAPGAAGSKPTVAPAAEGGFCDDWPAVLGGDGSSVSGAPGTYIWSDFHGIHLRANSPVPLTVTVTGNADYAVTHRGAGVTASAMSGTSLTFQLPAGDGTTGPDLNVPCATTGLRFEVLKDDLPVPPASIHIGGSGVATANPAPFLRTAG